MTPTALKPLGARELLKIPGVVPQRKVTMAG